MRAMKDSGIPWIGKIPESWLVPKLLYVLRAKICDGPHETPNYMEDGIPFISIDSLNDSKTINLENVRRYISDEDYEQYCQKTKIEHGDILFSKAATIGKTAIVGNERFMVWSPLAVIKHDPSRINNTYLYYLLNCSQLINAMALSGSVNTQINVGMREMEQARIPLPLLFEQKKIAEFLDAECARIDAVMEQTRASIEEYKKLKQSIITEAVTKGIRPNRPMKDSGIDWIGQIPEEWEIVPFRHVLQERNEKNNPVKTKERLSLSIDLGVTLYAEKTTNLDRFKEDFEQYKIAHVGDLVMNSMNMIVGATGVSSYHGCVSPAYYTFYDTLDDHVTAKYCEYIFRSKTMLRVLYSLGKGIYAIVRGDDRVNTCRLKVSREDLRNIALPMPSVCEQREIVRFLQDKLSEIDMVIAKKEQFLSEMESYKKSLIFEYVTGKKEVAQ